MNAAPATYMVRRPTRSDSQPTSGHMKMPMAEAISTPRSGIERSIANWLDT